MIHLFKKIYLETDKKLNVDSNRIVISEKNGYTVSSSAKDFFVGKLNCYSQNFESLLASLGAKEEVEEEIRLSENEENSFPKPSHIFENFQDFLNFVDKTYEETQQKLYIYVDQKSFNYFIINWYKILFPNLSFDSFQFLLKRIMTYEEIFSTNEIAWGDNFELDIDFSDETLKTIFDEVQIDEADSLIFMEKNRSSISVEFLLSSYFFDESHKNNLIPIFSLLVKRNIENILGSYRQRVFSFLSRKQFLKNLGLNDKYNSDNFYDLFEDKESVLYFFFDENIWSHKYLTHSDSNYPIKFENVTEKYLEDIAFVANRLELDEWEIKGLSEYLENFEGRTFKNIKNSGAICNRYDIVLFLKYFQNKKILTEEEFSKVLKYDLEKHLYGEINHYYTFCSSDYSTINNYFLDYIFESKRDLNLEKIKPFVLR